MNRRLNAFSGVERGKATRKNTGRTEREWRHGDPKKSTRNGEGGEK